MVDFKSNIHPLFLLILVVFLVFGNSLLHQFTYDDHKGVENNRYIESFNNLPRLFSSSYFNLFRERSYRPLVTASYFIDCFLWGKHAFGYHLTNILLHMATSLFFYMFAGYFFKEKGVRLFCALFFALHPVVCEPVNSISFREDLLAGLFVMLTLNLIFSHPAHSPLKMFLGVVTGLLALFSKESAVPLFFICLLLSFLKPWEDTGSKKNPHLPFLALQLLVLLFYVVIRFFVMTPSESWQTRLLGGGRVPAAAHAGYLFSKVWQTLVFPFHLNADYVFWNIRGIWTLYSVLGALFLTGYFILLVFVYKKGYKRIFIALCWIFLFFMPSSNLVPLTNPFAERYLYLILPGFAILAGLCYKSFLNKMRQRKGGAGNIFSLVPPAILLLLFAFLCINRNLVWSTDKTLWTSTLKREPESIRALNGVGLVFFMEGEIGSAKELFRKALAIDPMDYELRNNLAVVYMHDQKPELAKQELQRALQLNPDYAPAHYNLFRIYVSEGEEGMEKAGFHLERARELGYPVPDSFLHSPLKDKSPRK